MSESETEAEVAERIIGRNAVMEALRTDREIEKLTVLRQKPGAKAEGSLKKILAKAKDQRIPVEYADRAGLDRIAAGGVHQGVIATVSDYEYRTVEDLLQIPALMQNPRSIIESLYWIEEILEDADPFRIREFPVGNPKAHFSSVHRVGILIYNLDGQVRMNRLNGNLILAGDNQDGKANKR